MNIRRNNSSKSKSQIHSKGKPKMSDKRVKDTREFGSKFSKDKPKPFSSRNSSDERESGYSKSKSKPFSERASRGDRPSTFSKDKPKSFSSRNSSEERERGYTKTKSKSFSERTSSGERASTFSKDMPKSYKSKIDKYSDEKPKKVYRKLKDTQIINTHITKVKEDGEIRLNKYIAESGLCSRRKADEYIESGVVKINGKIAKELGMKVKASDNVTVNGDPISYYNKNVYILLNKPKDVVTTTADELGRKTVMDIVKRRERVFPVGRLDRNTTGVLILTNDGELAHRLTHPSFQIEKLYNATLDKKLHLDHAKLIAEGVELEDGKTAPCFVFVEPTDNTKVKLVLKEGKYREVRRMFEHFGYTVKKLDRKEFAGLSNAGMKRGEYRFLTTREINELKKIVKIL